MLAVKYEKPVQRLDSIQALRGIAATLVLFFHIADFQQEHLVPGSPDYQLTLGFWNYGYNGVDLFFVISGFIMVYVTRDILPSLRSAKHFLWSRITRIYPLWWICAAIMTTYFYLTYGIPAVPDLIASRDEAWSYAVKSFLLLPMDTTPVLGVGWTLIHEMFFYVIFAFSLLFLRKNRVWILLIWAGLVVIVNSVFGPNNGPNAVYNLALNPMSLEFIAGAFAAMALLKYQRMILPKSLCWIIIVSVIFYMAFMMSSGFELKDTDIDLQRTLFYALPFACLVFAFPHLEISHSLITSKPLKTLGDWSYLLYLTHLIVLLTFRRVLLIIEPVMPRILADLIMFERPGGLNNAIHVVIILVLCLITAWFFYKYIERPSLAYFRRNR